MVSPHLKDEVAESSVCPVPYVQPGFPRWMCPTGPLATGAAMKGVEKERQSEVMIPADAS